LRWFAGQPGRPGGGVVEVPDQSVGVDLAELRWVTDEQHCPAARCV
jgi:hypothetical protein